MVGIVERKRWVRPGQVCICVPRCAAEHNLTLFLLLNMQRSLHSLQYHSVYHLRISSAVRNIKLYISGLNSWVLCPTEAVHRWATQRWHSGSLPQWTQSFSLSALPVLIPCFILCVSNMTAATPHVTSMFQAKRREVKVKHFSVWEALAFHLENNVLPKTVFTSHWLELCHVTTSNYRGSWKFSFLLS